MKLILRSKENLIDKDFVQHLVDYMPELLMMKNFVNRKRLKKFDKYLKEEVFTQKRKYTAEQILVMGLRNLKPIISRDSATIEIDPNAQVPFYDMRVKDLVNLIEDGNLGISGMKILHKFFVYIGDNITELREKYELGMF